MTRPPEPNEPLLKSQAKIADYEALIGFIADHIKAPLPVTARFESMCVYQREIAQWIHAALVGPSIQPAEALEFLRTYWPDPPYQLEES